MKFFSLLKVICRGALAAMLLLLAISVSAQVEDTEAPLLLNLSYSPTSVNTSTSPQTINVSWELSDEGSGLFTGTNYPGTQLRFRSPSGGQLVDSSIFHGEAEVTGDEHHAFFETTAYFPRYSENGLWTIEYVLLIDVNWNYQYVYTDELVAMGFQTELFVEAGSEDVSPPQVLNFSYSPDSIDTSSGAQTVTFNWELSDELAGIFWLLPSSRSESQVRFRSPSGNQFVDTGIYGSGTLVSGNTYHAFYETEAVFPQNSEAGIWEIETLFLSDGIGNHVWLDADQVAAMGFQTQIEVEGLADNAAPELLGFNFSPTSVDISDAAQTVNISWEIQDSGAGLFSDSYFSDNYLRLTSPSGNQTVISSLSPDSLVSGDNFHGIYESSLVFPRYSETGIWEIEELFLEDAFGNYVTLDASQLAALGIPTQLEVTGIGDTVAPELLNMSFSPPVIDTSDSAQTVTVSLEVSDELVGVFPALYNNYMGFEVSFLSPSRDKILSAWIYGEENLVSGDAFHGTFETTVEFPRYSEAGLWTVNYVFLVDAVGNYVSLDTNAIEALGLPSELEVQGIGDTNPPQLLNLSYSPSTIDVSGSDQTVIFNWELSDDLAGLGENAFGNLLFRSPSGNEYQYTYWYSDNMVSSDGLHAFYETEMLFPAGSEVGVWQLEFMYLYDNNYNFVRFYGDEILAMGFPVEITVTDSPVANTPVGTDVSVEFRDDYELSQISLRFEEVSEAGISSATAMSADLAPAGFRIGNPPMYFQLSSTAVYSGWIEVCLDYEQFIFLNLESNLRLFSYENGKWLDVTSYQDTENNLLCGNLTSLSIVGIFEPENREPVANADAVSTNQDTPVVIDVLANDHDEDGNLDYFISASTFPANGNVETNADNITLTYTPNAGFVGTDSFNYWLCDVEGACVEGTVTVTVLSVNSSPAGVADSYSLDEDSSLNLDTTAGVLANDSDADGDALSVMLLSDVSKGSLSLNADGSFSYSPNANFFGSDSFSYQLSDGEATSETVTVTLTVNPVNDLPTISVNTTDLIINEGETANNSGTIADVDGDLLSLSASVGSVNNLGDGSWAWNYTSNDNAATSSVTITVTDAQGASASVSMNLTINNLNPTGTVTAASSTVLEGSSLNLSFSDVFDASSVDFASLQFAVDCNSDGSYESSGSSSALSCVYSENGSYTVTGQVSDKDGGYSVSSLQVVVENAAPTVFAGDDLTNRPPDTTVINASFSDPGILDSHSATIDWGDGTIESLAIAGNSISGSHKYNGNGTFTATICVTDDEGATGCDMVIVNIVPGPPDGHGNSGN